MMKDYRDLDVWKRANAMVLDVYPVTNLFPRSKQFGVVCQLRRAANLSGSVWQSVLGEGVLPFLHGTRDTDHGPQRIRRRF